MRLIDAEKLLKTIMSLESWNVPDFVYESINNAPTEDAMPFCMYKKVMQKEIERRKALEPVVRCKDCKWCHAGYCEKADDIIPFGFPQHEWENFYCAWGEREEDGNKPKSI